VVDEEHVVFADLYSRKTRENLRANPSVSVTVVDTTTATGYQVKGTAEMLDSGPLYEGMAAELAAAPKEFPPLQYVVYISVEEVYDQSIGPQAGEQIA
jgi:predicted pyridoxine 5'-phosphate oxidase superfamily flavin-nucleotide-binding protein